MIIKNNVIFQESQVARSDRNLLNQHNSTVVWFTGLSGAGKTTIAHEVERLLYQLNCHSVVLDGDNIRHGLCSDLGFSDSDRKENIRRVGEVAKLMMETGLIVITSFISPFRDDREYVRNLLPHGDFIEVYCRASLSICEKRDVKGLYRRARKGGIANYTGIDSPYEEPINPELALDTEMLSIEESTNQVMNMLRSKGVIID